jgi:hypothetical protein
MLGQSAKDWLAFAIFMVVTGVIFWLSGGASPAY